MVLLKEAVVDAVRTNVISEERINDSLKRIFRVKYREEYESNMAAGGDKDPKYVGDDGDDEEGNADEDRK